MKHFVLLMTFLCQAIGLMADQPKSLDEKIGQLIMVGFRGYEINEADWIAQQISKGQVGGIILYAWDTESKQYVRNIKSAEQLKKLCTALQSQASIPLLIAVDQEGGVISHLKPEFGFPETVSAETLGKEKTIDRTYQQGLLIGKMLSDAGININFSPVVDVNINPQSPCIGKKGRSFSSDPNIVAKHALAIIEGHHQYGVMTALKHFPGHGSALADTHAGFVDITKTWKEEELIPYKIIIADKKADVIMTAHVFNQNLDQKLPASLSPYVINGLLRDKLGYQGVIISDDLQMGAIWKFYSLDSIIKMALNAGVDIIQFSNQQTYDPDIAVKAIAIIKKLIETGEISEDRINQSYDRIIKLKKNYPSKL